MKVYKELEAEYKLKTMDMLQDIAIKLADDKADDLPSPQEAKKTLKKYECIADLFHTLAVKADNKAV